MKLTAKISVVFDCHNCGERCENESDFIWIDESKSEKAMNFQTNSCYREKEKNNRRNASRGSFNSARRKGRNRNFHALKIC